MFIDAASPISAPDQLDLSAPLHVDAHGLRSWRMRSGWLEPVRHRLAVRQGDAPLWRFLIDHQDHRHIHLTGGAWLLSDIGMARLAHLGAGGGLMFRAPKPIVAPPPPTIDQARIAAEAADDLAQRRGRAATFVAGARDRVSGMTATKMLTGQGG